MFAALLFYVLTVIGLFVLRRKRPDLDGLIAPWLSAGAGHLRVACVPPS